jgi:formylglycine-generating enzyme required for sulfatase activity
MKTRLFILVALLCSVAPAPVWAAPPVVSNVQASQRAASQIVDITYNVSDPDGGTVTVSVLASADGGTNWDVPVFTMSGHVGTGVPLGAMRQIVWNAGIDWPGKYTDRCRVRVIADDGSGGVAPPGMSLVPGGSFQMGDNLDSIAAAQPVHTVSLSPYFIDQLEVSQGRWEQVRQWATNNGYTDLPASGVFGFRDHYPTDNINWYAAVKWCNARSQMENLIPAYYTDSAQTTVYRTGSVDLVNGAVRWAASGYRLPTEAEWEKATRAGANGLRYPWGNTISNSQANYLSSGDPFETVEVESTPVGYYNGNQIPAGTNMANGYGLYDVAGNAAEWCWDWYDSYPALPQSNPHGPATGSARVNRGASSLDDATALTCASRSASGPAYPIQRLKAELPFSPYPISGFRCVRSFGP